MELQHIETVESVRGVRFGRIRWWTEESPSAFAAVTLLSLVLTILIWLLLLVQFQEQPPTDLAVGLQPISLAAAEADDAADQSDIQVEQTLGEGAVIEPEPEVQIEVPEARADLSDVQVEVPEANQTEQKLRQQAKAAAEYAKELQRALSGETGATRSESSGGGIGGDPNSTGARMHRWVIRYPAVPSLVYAQILDHFGVELGWQASAGMIEYVRGFSRGLPRRRRGPVGAENRLFWYPANAVSLAADLEVLARFNIRPSGTVIHFYPKRIENQLAKLELEALQNRYGTRDLRRVRRTVFEIQPSGRGWTFVVGEITLNDSPRLNFSP